MFNFIKEYRHYLFAFTLIVIPLISLNSKSKSPSELYWFDRVILQITVPVQNLLTWSIDTTWEAAENYFLLLDTKQNNKALIGENRKLLSEIAAFKEIALENQRLRKLVKFSQAIPGKKVTARVIARDIYPEFRTIRLNKGKSDGVSKGMAVVTHEGIVGRIFRVAKNFSDVLILLDGASAIDALIQRNRSRGIIEGLTENLLSLKYIPRTENIQVGDVVLSSGIGTLFPKGLLIGKVVNVRKKNYGITQTIEVHPSVNFSKIEEVTIVKPSVTSDALPKGELPASTEVSEK